MSKLFITINDIFPTDIEKPKMSMCLNCFKSSNNASLIFLFVKKSTLNKNKSLRYVLKKYTQSSNWQTGAITIKTGNRLRGKFNITNIMPIIETA